MKRIEKSIELGGKTLTLTTGHIAEQADGAIMAQYGDTVVLATVVASPLKAELDYFPLSVEYQERLYAGGRIKGSRWVKREGKPTDDEILTARLVDRSIRPLFPKEYKKDVQVIITVLSVDMENPPDIVAGIAASAAVAVSTIPWHGPIGVIRVGMDEEGKYITNPQTKENGDSKLDLIVASTKDAVVMIEAGAKQVTEKEIIKGVEYSQKETIKLIDIINDLAKDVGNKKEAVEKQEVDKSLYSKVKKLADNRIDELIVGMATNKMGYFDYDAIKAAIADETGEEGRQQAKTIFEDLFKSKLREMLLSGKRPDGRKADQIRELSAIVGVLPRTHGSAIFKRGATQVLSIATLGASSLEQLIETAEGEETKRYMHHYSMPPYSTGEAGRVGSPSRREIGHGALAERALEPVIPSEDDFPYAIRVVSEVLSSNGSTSMASTCGSTLALMDAGVPIIAPIAGAAMGLVIDSEEKYTVLTDIVGLEDGNGDMDFKVAGSKEGITAMQLDVKTLKLTVGVLEKALEQAKVSRLKILDVMLATIPEPRSTVSTYAPKIKMIKIDPEKIGELIGPGGKTIKKIIAETGAMIDVEDDGTVSISGMTDDVVKAAVDRVESLTKDVVSGEIYEGEVKRLQPFGAFVEVLPGKDGLVHVSDMSTEFVKDPADIVSIGEKVTVRVKEVDDFGRINLSMILDPSQDEERKKERQERRMGQRDRFPRRREGTRMGRPDRPRSSGPHFPTSRLVDNKGKYSR
jgi:polyribonucleotide nucleotidyltransferase